ncbi:50S ribosomal protein L14p (L23e) [Candidatus Nasuia deltocephalinicola]|nr:50S ribosomal protein L14p (L23e) [Candidatus Nasuia deltocephalinicola]
MIQVESKLLVADNSGAKLVSCIKILGGSKKKYAFIGDLIKVSIKKCLFKSKVKKGDILNAVLIRTKKNFCRLDGVCFKFYNNYVVLLNNKLEPIASRIIGPIPRDLKFSKFYKLLSLSSDIF